MCDCQYLRLWLLQSSSQHVVSIVDNVKKIVPFQRQDNALLSISP